MFGEFPVGRPIQPARGITAKQEQMNKAVSFPNCGQIRSTMATETKTSNQLIDGFRNDLMLVIHQEPARIAMASTKVRSHRATLPKDILTVTSTLNAGRDVDAFVQQQR
jgi:hypothetical protein